MGTTFRHFFSVVNSMLLSNSLFYLSVEFNDFKSEIRSEYMIECFEYYLSKEADLGEFNITTMIERKNEWIGVQLEKSQDRPAGMQGFNRKIEENAQCSRFVWHAGKCLGSSSNCKRMEITKVWHQSMDWHQSLDLRTQKLTPPSMLIYLYMPSMLVEFICPSKIICFNF